MLPMVVDETEGKGGELRKAGIWEQGHMGERVRG